MRFLEQQEKGDFFFLPQAMKMHSYSNVGVIKVWVGSSDILLSHPLWDTINELFIYALALGTYRHLIFIYFYLFHNIWECGGKSSCVAEEAEAGKAAVS